MQIRNQYDMEEMVYLRTDSDQLERVVTGIMIRPNNLLVYELSCANEKSDHHEFEISKDKVVK